MTDVLHKWQVARAERPISNQLTKPVFGTRNAVVDRLLAYNGTSQASLSEK